MYWRENTKILPSNLKRITEGKCPLVYSVQFIHCCPEMTTAGVLGKKVSVWSFPLQEVTHNMSERRRSFYASGMDNWPF